MVVGKVDGRVVVGGVGLNVVGGGGGGGGNEEGLAVCTTLLLE